MREAGWIRRRAMARIPGVPAASAEEKCRHPAQGRGGRSLRRPGRSKRGGRLRPGQGAAHRRGPGHRHGQLPHAKGEDHFRVLPGDDVKLTLPHRRHAAQDRQRQLHHRRFLREQDERIRHQFRLRADPQAAGVARHDRSRARASANVNCDRDQAQARRRRQRGPRQAARRAFARGTRTASHTWRDKQGALLAAVQMETTILNVLLFMIIAVAGFGILAIFYMIVVEKTRDIGILKSLGASGRGVMGIFLAYGLSLGLVGSGVGMVAGLLVRPLHQPHRRRPGLDHRPPAVQSRNLLLLQDPHHRFPVDRRLDRAGGRGDRRAGQRPAGGAGGPLHPVEALRYE